MKEYDEKTLERWKSEMDNLLIFVSISLKHDYNQLQLTSSDRFTVRSRYCIHRGIISMVEGRPGRHVGETP